jgi:hypothetical protein
VSAINFPNIESTISSASDLVDILRAAKRCIALGVLRQVRPVNAPFASADLSSIPDQGPWPDYLEAYFEDRQGALYKLSVETYHGAGGSWTRL